METIAIAGVGLIGGSFALALRKAGFTGRIIGVLSRSTEEALRLGVIDQAVTLKEACQTASLLYLAQPVKGILKTLEEIAGTVGRGCLVTDAGSTKIEICRRAKDLGIPSFVGGHPMAGKETSGVGAADPDIFVSRTYVLTPLPSDSEWDERASDLKEWIERIGGKVTLLSPQEHDRIVAFTSHLPQVLSSCLAATLVAESFQASDLEISGSGLRDTTRLAMSSYEVWADILSTNHVGIDRAIGKFIDKLNFFRQNLTNPDLREEFEKASSLASILRRSSES